MQVCIYMYIHIYMCSRIAPCDPPSALSLGPKCARRRGSTPTCVGGGGWARRGCFCLRDGTARKASYESSGDIICSLTDVVPPHHLYCRKLEIIKFFKGLLLKPWLE